MSAKDIIENKIAKKLSEDPGKAKSIGAKIAIELSGDGGGRWTIDMTKEPAVVLSDLNGSAETTIKATSEDFEAMVNGTLSPQAAFFSGKLKIDGNLAIALKLGQLFN